MLKANKKPRPSSANDALGASRPRSTLNSKVAISGTMTSSANGSSSMKYRGINHKLLKEYDSPLNSPERKHNRSLSPKERQRAKEEIDQGNSSSQNLRSLKNVTIEGENSVAISINDGEVVLLFLCPLH